MSDAAARRLPRRVPAGRRRGGRAGGRRHALDAGAGIATHRGDATQVDEAQAEAWSGPTTDPHVWLDPTNMARIVDTVAQRLSTVDPAGAADVRRERERPRRRARPRSTASGRPARRRAATATSSCRTRRSATSPSATTSRRSASPGSSPDAEPSPAKIAEVADFVRANGVTHDLLRDAGRPEGRRRPWPTRPAPPPPCWTRSRGWRKDRPTTTCQRHAHQPRHREEGTALHVNREHAPPQAAGESPVVRRCRARCVTFDGECVVDEVTLTITAGEFVAVLGENGAGQDHAHARAARADSALARRGARCTAYPWSDFRDWDRIGYVPQRLLSAGAVPMSVREVVASARWGPQLALAPARAGRPRRRARGARDRRALGPARRPARHPLRRAAAPRAHRPRAGDRRRHLRARRAHRRASTPRARRRLAATLRTLRDAGAHGACSSRTSSGRSPTSPPARSSSAAASTAPCGTTDRRGARTSRTTTRGTTATSSVPPSPSPRDAGGLRRVHALRTTSCSGPWSPPRSSGSWRPLIGVFLVQRRLALLGDGMGHVALSRGRPRVPARHRTRCPPRWSRPRSARS